MAAPRPMRAILRRVQILQNAQKAPDPPSPDQKCDVRPKRPNTPSKCDPIEDANFCFFIGIHILSEGDAHLREIRPRGSEMIVHYPLSEIFSHHRCKGVRAKEGLHFALQSLCAARCDPINHRARKCNTAADPLGKILGSDQIKIGKEVALQHFAISPNIITA